MILLSWRCWSQLLFYADSNLADILNNGNNGILKYKITIQMFGVSNVYFYFLRNKLFLSSKGTLTWSKVTVKLLHCCEKKISFELNAVLLNSYINPRNFILLEYFNNISVLLYFWSNLMQLKILLTSRMFHLIFAQF